MWMLQWTGEKFLPAIRDASNVYRYIHRYIYISQFLKNKRVLDLTAGDGRGSSILSQSAASVVALVTDEVLAASAAEKYKQSNVEFRTQLVSLDDHSFDAIVWFDPFEGSIDPAWLLNDYRRQLKAGALMIVSTTSDQVDEVWRLLSRHFKNVQAYGQGLYANSSIWPLKNQDSERVSQILVSRNETDEFHALNSGRRLPLCFILIASDVPIAVEATESVFIDEGNELLADKEKAIRELTDTKTYQAAALKSSEAQLAERRESLAFLQEAFAWHTKQIHSWAKTREYMERKILDLKGTVASDEKALAWRAAQVADMEKVLAGRDTAVDSLRKQIEALQRRIEAQEKALGWHASRIEALEEELKGLRILAPEP